MDIDPRYRLMFEGLNLDPIDDYDVFESEGAALDAFDEVVAHPTPDLGSVYLVERRDHGDVVIGRVTISSIRPVCSPCCLRGSVRPAPVVTRVVVGRVAALPEP